MPLAFASAPRFSSSGTIRRASAEPSSAAHARRKIGGPSVPSAAILGSLTGDRCAGGFGSGPSCSSNSSGLTSYLVPVPFSSLAPFVSVFPARGVVTASTASLIAPRAAASASSPAFLARYTVMSRSYIANVARYVSCSAIASFTTRSLSVAALARISPRSTAFTAALPPERLLPSLRATEDTGPGGAEPLFPAPKSDASSDIAPTKCVTSKRGRCLPRSAAPPARAPTSLCCEPV